jgi:hypothetical protein
MFTPIEIRPVETLSAAVRVPAPRANAAALVIASLAEGKSCCGTPAVEDTDYLLEALRL